MLKERPLGSMKVCTRKEMNKTHMTHGNVKVFRGMLEFLLITIIIISTITLHEEGKTHPKIYK